MSNKVTRRSFLATTAAAVPAAALSGSGLHHDLDPPAATYIRRDIGGLSSASDPIIQSYKTAITAMQALPYTNPLSWAYQAAIHGTTLGDNLPAWNTCEHGTIYFWSWHRMYLYWFERIIRKMSGDPNWALPYWNYNAISQRTLPSVFRTPTTGNPLYVANRGSLGGGSWNAGTAAFPDTDVDYSAGLMPKPFYTAQSALECLPHNQIHGDIGGWMGNVCTAAQDPVFFVHHANIDRLWSHWLAQGSRSDPGNDPTWTNKTSIFFDENGNQVKMSACDVLRTAQQLNYTYESECTEVNQYCFYICCIWQWLYCCQIFLDIPPFPLGPDPVYVPIGVLDDQYWSAVERGDNVVLQLGNVDALKAPGASWEVYVGFPPGPIDPYPQSPYYLGNLSLFAVGIHDNAHHHGGEFQYAKFEYVANRAILATEKGAPLMLTIVPHPILVNGKAGYQQVQSPVNVGKVSWAIAKETEVRPTIK